MIVPERRQLILLTSYVGQPLLGLIAYDVAVVLLYKAGYLKWATLEQVPLSMLGTAIGILLAFRNSSSYARWWEARTLWGTIVNNSRSWGRAVTTVMHLHDLSENTAFFQMRQRMVYLQIAWVHALRQQLRQLEPWEELAPLLSDEEITVLRGQRNLPMAIQQMQSTLLLRATESGWIDSMQWHAMNQSLDDLADAQGGAERIKNTPLPRQYDYLPQLCAQIFCFLLPFAMVSSLGWFTPLGSSLVGFIFLTLDKIGRDLENPFGNTAHDIPLTAMSRTIEINLRQMLGETNLPPDLQTINGIMW